MRINKDRLKRYAKLFLWAIVVLVVWGFFGIKNITVTGNKQLSKSEIIKTAQASTSHRPWRNNLLTLDEAALRKDLLASNYRFKSVSFVRHLPKSLEIKVAERQPSLNWQTGGQTYTLDVDGSLIGPAEPGSPLPTVLDSANLPVKAGDKVVPAKFVKFCTDIVEQMPKRTGVAVASLRVPDTTSEVYVTTNKGYLIKFDTTREASEQIDDLVNVLATLSRIKKTPAEYIDLRVENRAYYR
ncbi:MAG TPA: FtsQ-type POTRA domain-containing protein [Candidatus Nanoarchaeia archaeon]|nr:FtsQ-type POTRA domain-containing protein [Candidatus Nanoarchaeia archaeon]